jgi:hypothetical protein
MFIELDSVFSWLTPVCVLIKSLLASLFFRSITSDKSLSTIILYVYTALRKKIAINQYKLVSTIPHHVVLVNETASLPAQTIINHYKPF